MQGMVGKYKNPVKVVATGINKNERRLLVKKKAFNWLMDFSSHPIEKVIDLDNVVYLTDDAEEVFQELDPKVTYVIGGVVGQLTSASLALEKAESLGMRVQRMPTEEHMALNEGNRLNSVQGEIISV